jgi:hypothetical protein
MLLLSKKPCRQLQLFFDSHQPAVSDAVYYLQWPAVVIFFFSICGGEEVLISN